jgi:hypothetical protein
VECGEAAYGMHGSKGEECHSQRRLARTPAGRRKSLTASICIWIVGQTYR